MRNLLMVLAVSLMTSFAIAESDIYLFHLPGGLSGNQKWIGAALPNALQAGFVTKPLTALDKVGPNDKLFVVMSWIAFPQYISRDLAQLVKLHERGTKIILLIQVETGCDDVNSDLSNLSNILVSKYGFLFQCEYSSTLWGKKSTIDAGVVLPGLTGMLVSRGGAHLALVFPRGNAIGSFHPISMQEFYNGKKAYSFSAVSEDGNFLIVSLPGYDDPPASRSDVLTNYTVYDNDKVATALLEWLIDGKSLW